MTEEQELVHLDLEGGVARITLDSPANRNALSRRLLADLRRHVDTALADPRARVLVLTGTGSVFCAGADLKEQRAANEAAVETGPGLLAGILHDLWSAPKPVLGRINGHARAGGIGLVAACDLSVAPAEATFAINEVRLGLIPAVIAAVVLPKLTITRAAELFLTGETFDAATAERVGLITAAAPAGALDETVERYLAALLRGGPAALGGAKRLLRETPAQPSRDSFERLTALSAEYFASAEALEGMSAFAEKRPPRWTEPHTA